MKKLLGLFAIAPMAVTACGGSAEAKGLHGVNVGSNTGIMDGLLNESIDIAGTWGDARFNATGGADSGVYEDIVVIGVEENRIANDGIQAAPNMSEADIYWAQELFEKVTKATDLTAPIGEDDDGNVKDVHVLELYGHENYEKIRDSANKTVSYLKDGVAIKKDMLTSNIPTTALAGTIFDASGKVADGQTLDIEFIPSTNPEHATAASAKLQTWLNENWTVDGGEVKVTIAADYDAAAQKLNESTVDLAFLPVNTWAQNAPKAEFILQAGRSAQVATLDMDPITGAITQPSLITNQKLTTNVMNRFSQLYVADVTTTALDKDDLSSYQEEFKASLANMNDEFHGWAKSVQTYAEDGSTSLIAGSYESYIWAKRGSEIETLVTQNYRTADYKNDWKTDISGLTVKYGFTGTTSSSTFLFPELWLKNHLDATIKL